METLRVKDFFRPHEEISMVQSVYLPGQHVEHTHDFLEIVYVHSGRGRQRIGGEEIAVGKGDLFLINYNVPHCFMPETPDFGWTNCLFLPHAVDSSLFQGDDGSDVLTFIHQQFLNSVEHAVLRYLPLYQRDREFSRLFEEMLREYEEARNGYQEVLRQFLLVLLIRIFRSYAQESRQDPLHMEHQIIHATLRVLKEGAHKPLTLEALSKEVGLTPTYLSSLFKKKTGYGITTYLHRLRIGKACDMLQATTWPISSIMHEVGYQDTKFFYEVFKRYTGRTPGQFRKEKVPGSHARSTDRMGADQEHEDLRDFKRALYV